MDPEDQAALDHCNRRKRLNNPGKAGRRIQQITIQVREADIGDSRLVSSICSWQEDIAACALYEPSAGQGRDDWILDLVVGCSSRVQSREIDLLDFAPGRGPLRQPGHAGRFPRLPVLGRQSIH